MIEQLRQQKAELLNWYIFTKDKAIRKEIRKLDKMIRKEIIKNDNNCIDNSLLII